MRTVSKLGYPKYEPIMFDMDLFYGKNVPRTKNQESCILLTRNQTMEDRGIREGGRPQATRGQDIPGQPIGRFSTQ